MSENQEQMSKGTSDESNAEFIVLRVIGNDSVEIDFRLKMTTKMGKVMNSYSKKRGFLMESLRFLFNGWRIYKEQTPEELKMKNKDIIEVLIEQTGGF